MELYLAARDGKDVEEVKAAIKTRKADEAKAKLDSAMDDYRTSGDKPAEAASVADGAAPASKAKPATATNGSTAATPAAGSAAADAAAPADGLKADAGGAVAASAPAE
eukprot:TRINITY_DN984_c0_g1_i1.p4 TRINITY_DN984_c0_g1~~TRINITY_DN984_c0_g1_i1.p4  ORF type:complete len:108 (-),score=45.37 TRINITY_DN984_c0_g1_i1:310-633(-)